ncbi:neutral amino acid transporter [Entophlyctis luteolus]|nr:neutral amino acid transporter [Entophlyctis luteolus]
MSKDRSARGKQPAIPVAATTPTAGRPSVSGDHVSQSPSPSRNIAIGVRRNRDGASPMARSPMGRSLPRGSFKPGTSFTSTEDMESRIAEYSAMRVTNKASNPALDQAAARIIESHLVAPPDVEQVASSYSSRLQGGAITSDIYHWADKQRHVATSPTPSSISDIGQNVLRQTRRLSNPELQSAHLRNTTDVLTASQLREPGAFRRSFIINRAERRGAPQPTFLTRNFIDFLALYGFYGGDVVPDASDDDDDDDDDNFYNAQEASSPRASSVQSIPPPDERSSLLGGNRVPQRSMSMISEATNVKGTSSSKAFFMCIKAFVGTGVLFLPKAFSQGGLGFSILLLLLFGWLNLHCMLLLLETSKELGGSFGDIGEKLYGPPMRRLVLASIAISQAGFACAYYIFVAQNLRDLLMLFSNCTIILPDWVFLLVQIAIYVPLSWVRKIQFFSITSLVADVFILMGLAFIFSQNISVLSTVGPAADIIWFNMESFPIFIGTALFAFEGICLILPIAESMKEPQKFPRVLTFCVIVIGITFMVIGASGYLAFGLKVETVVFLNMPKSDFVLTLQFFYALAIILSFPLCVYPPIRITESALFGLADGKSSLMVKWQKNLMRACFVSFLAFVAWTGSSNLDKFVSLVGCFACIPLSFIYPAIFHYNITNKPWVKVR